ncbi:MAG: hypothetical protein KQJ78_14505 [Deltaproteobacteria bacterium]|nr:hypothetical protein [Deltaproteobacteria bacterium]
MQRKFGGPLILALLLVSLMVPGLAAGPAAAATATGVLPPTQLGWEIMNASVVDPGTKVQTKDGVMITGCKVTATAVGAKAGNPLPQAKFVLEFSLFQPAAAMPGQQAGQWSLSGSWQIQPENWSEADAKVRYSENLVKGGIQATLPANPFETMVNYTAQVRVTSASGVPTNTKGTFLGNEDFEGQLQFGLNARMNRAARVKGVQP